MTTRVVMADQSEARFYDLEPADGTLTHVDEMQNPAARLHDRDLKSDRPGRVFDHAQGDAHRRGAVAHHATGGEETPKHHEAVAFSNRIVHALELAHNEHAFDRLVLIAGPPFIGLLRAAMPKRLADLVTIEIGKDLMHEPESALRSHLAADIARAKLES